MELQQPKKRGPYKAYGDNVPRTTRWRKKLKLFENIEHIHEGVLNTDGGIDMLVDQSEPEMEEPTSSDILGSPDDILDDSSSVKYADDEDDDSDLEDCEEPSTSNDDSQPLYDGTLLTLWSAMLLIMTFALRHSLSKSALSDLLTLIGLMVPSSVATHFTLANFNRYYQKLGTPTCNHFYCGSCKFYMGTDIDKCTGSCKKCGRSMGSENHFISIPIAEQLKNILPECLENMQEYQSSHVKGDNLSDVFDGQLYKEVFDGSHFRGTTEEDRRREIHVSLQMNTDGVSLFRSSSFSVWPIYFIINELPPALRFTRKYRLFSAMWFGKNKPEMDILMRVICTQLKDLFHTGFEFCVQGVKKTARAVLLSGVFDAPARSMVQNFVQFNGYFGCGTCLSKGSSVHTLQNTRTQAYPYNVHEGDYNGHGPIRDHEDTLQHGLKAEQEGTPKFGVKGVTWLVTCPRFNLIRGVTIDYMHCVCLGVVKKLLSLWMNAQYRHFPWFIGTRKSEFEKRLHQIKPPNRITRLPRSFNDLSNWKATEFRNFLLFYAVPTLHGILPDKYFNHLACLIHGIFVLSCTSISKDKLKEASLNINRFCSNFSALYHESFESSNMHALLHLPNKVLDLGPLWAHSCFFFEDLNKDLRLMFHGTQNVAQQIIQAVSITQKIPELVCRLVPGSPAFNFYEHMQGHHKVRSCTKRISNNLFSVGTLKACILDPPVLQLVQQFLRFDGSTVFYRFERVLLNHTVLHSEVYKPVSRRNSYAVKFVLNEKTLYGLIQYYLCCDMPNKDEYVAVVRELKFCNDMHLNINHFAVVSETTTLLVVPLACLMEICIFLPFHSTSYHLVSTFPNFVEHE